MTTDEQAVWAEHFQRLQRLMASGQPILAGPTLGTVNTGLVIFEAPGEQAARQVMEEDPVVCAATHAGKSARFGHRCCADETDLHDGPSSCQRLGEVTWLHTRCGMCGRLRDPYPPSPLVASVSTGRQPPDAWPRPRRVGHL
jgi:uncharacterized protein YciI